jgi:antitoxin component of MazEF toxin-antitoxin module
MTAKNRVLVAIFVGAFFGTSSSAGTLAAYGQATDAQPAIAKRIGTIKAINAAVLTLAPSSGSEVSVTLQPTARILQLAPGEKDLKNATPLQVQDLHVGDTIRVRGSASADGNAISALEVIVITQAAVAAVSDQIRQDWQKRGLGGLVESVDAAAGAVTVSIPSLAAKKTVVVHTTKDTVVYRYAPDSAKPEDAKPSGLTEIHRGDQLRARGNKNAEGTEIMAEEVYAGVFPQYAATVKSVDASSGVLSVQDLGSKKIVQVRVIGNSQLHKIPAEMAQMFAMRLKSIMPAGMPGAAGGSQGRAKPASPANAQTPSPAGSTWSGGGNGGGMRSGGAPDFQRMLSRMPTATLAELNLQKGDAVIILATEGTPGSPHTAITLLSGVEPILQAAPGGSSAMMLTPWNLGGGAPGGDASQ